MKTITVQQGLSELKTLDARINKAVSDSRLIGILGNGKMVDNGRITDPQEFKTNAQSSIDSIKSLIDYRNKLKSAIVLSNATTFVVIGGNEMTVAEAIERKDSISLLNLVYSTIARQEDRAVTKVASENAKIDREFEEALKTFLGGDKSSTKTGDLASITESLRGQYDGKKVEVYDPHKASDWKLSLYKEYEDFLTEVDYALTVSNVKTEITVEI